MINHLKKRKEKGCVHLCKYAQINYITSVYCIVKRIYTVTQPWRSHNTLNEKILRTAEELRFLLSLRKRNFPRWGQ